MIARYIELRPEEDEELRLVDQNPYIRKKVRLRAQIIRLSNQGWSIERIAKYTKRSRWSIARDFDRWETEGMGGLVDSKPPGNKSPIKEEHRAFLREKLAEEQVWTAPLLAEELKNSFGIPVSRENVRKCILEMGYTYKRHRYIPVKQAEPEALRESKADLDTLKKGMKKDGWS